MKYFFVVLIMLKVHSAYAQKKVILYNLYTESKELVYCGNLPSAQLLIFAKDTSVSAIKNKADQYYIFIECPREYGEDFFKARQKYEVILSKKYHELAKRYWMSVDGIPGTELHKYYKNVFKLIHIRKLH